MNYAWIPADASTALPPLLLEEVIDAIYEAGVLPELWPDVLDRVASFSDAIGGVLFTANHQGLRWTASDAMVAPMQAFVDGGWIERNPRAARAAALDHAGFVSDLDLLTPDEIEADAMYAFLRSRGMGWCAGTVVPVPSGDHLVFSWERTFGRGPFAPALVRSLDPLRPHLARAGLISARLGLERVKAATAVLGLLGLPALVLSHARQTLGMNQAMADLIPHVVEDRRERVRLANATADALLAETLTVLENGRVSAPVASIPIPAARKHDPVIVHVVPVRGHARDLFLAASCILVLTPVTQANVPSAEVIQGLFDLTPTEARVAQAVARGNTVEEVAATAQVSVGTVRSQLKSVFLKVGVNRQAELAGLLSTGLPIGAAHHRPRPGQSA